MKKMTMVLAVAVIVAIAGSAFAFNMPTTSGSLKNEVKKEATRQAGKQVAKPINRDLQQKKYQCTWDPKTRSVTGCNLRDIGAYLALQRKSVEAASRELTNTYSDFNVYIHANSDAYQTVKPDISKWGGSWDYLPKTTSGNKIAFSVEITD